MTYKDLGGVGQAEAEKRRKELVLEALGLLRRIAECGAIRDDKGVLPGRRKDLSERCSLSR